MEATATRCQMPEPVEVWTGAAGDIIMDYSKLRGRIVEKYGSITSFGDHLHISKVQLSKKLTGKVGISQKDILEWSELLEIPITDIGTYFFTLAV